MTEETERAIFDKLREMIEEYKTAEFQVMTPNGTYLDGRKDEWKRVMLFLQQEALKYIGHPKTSRDVP